MVYLFHVLVELLLGDLLLLRESASFLEELEPAGRDGGNDLQGTQTTSGQWRLPLSRPLSLSATPTLLTLSSDPLT